MSEIHSREHTKLTFRSPAFAASRSVASLWLVTCFRPSVLALALLLVAGSCVGQHKEWTWKDRAGHTHNEADLQKILHRHLEWLRSGHRSGEQADLSGADLRGADLQNAVLVYAILQGANLDGANLASAQMYRANLRGAVFGRPPVSRTPDTWPPRPAPPGDVVLRVVSSDQDTSPCAREFAEGGGNGNFTGANFNEADLEGVQMPGVDLSSSNLSGAHLSGADLVSADLSHADMSNAVLRGSKLGGAWIDCARLDGADLVGADLASARLKSATLLGLGSKTLIWRMATWRGRSSSPPVFQPMSAAWQRWSDWKRLLTGGIPMLWWSFESSSGTRTLNSRKER